jgi:long-chain acyl-CoA synthetase
MLEVYLAATSIGLYVTPINHHLVGPEIAYILSDSDAKVLVGHERFADVLTVAVAESGFPLEQAFAIGEIPGWRAYDELTAGQPTDRPARRSAGGPMHYTSGTTGRPKGVKRALPEIDPDELAGLYSMFLMLFGVQPEDGNVHITGSPLYHTAVLLWTANSLHMGHAVVLMDKWTPEGMLQLIERHKVTTSHMVPTQFHRILALPEEVRARYDCSSTRCMVHAAAPCPLDVKRRMIEWWGDAIMEYYAATEGGGTIVTAKEWLERPGTVGKAWAGAEVRILDDDGNQLGPNQIGTVYMALAQATFEYKGDEQKTKGNRVYFPDGTAFFTVGDVGELDDDGYLFLRDRKIDMIISGGVNIYPAEIEGTFLSCPLVGDIAAFGIPNDDWGEEIKVVVEPAADRVAGPELEAALREFAEANLASYKRPKTYDFTTEMPRDPSGKLYKRKLRDPYWEGKQRAI